MELVIARLGVFHIFRSVLSVINSQGTGLRDNSRIFFAYSYHCVNSMMVDEYFSNQLFIGLTSIVKG